MKKLIQLLKTKQPFNSSPISMYALLAITLFSMNQSEQKNHSLAPNFSKVQTTMEKNIGRNIASVPENKKDKEEKKFSKLTPEQLEILQGIDSTTLENYYNCRARKPDDSTAKLGEEIKLHVEALAKLLPKSRYKVTEQNAGGKENVKSIMAQITDFMREERAEREARVAQQSMIFNPQVMANPYTPYAFAQMQMQYQMQLQMQQMQMHYAQYQREDRIAGQINALRSEIQAGHFGAIGRAGYYGHFSQYDSLPSYYSQRDDGSSLGELPKSGVMNLMSHGMNSVYNIHF